MQRASCASNAPTHLGLWWIRCVRIVLRLSRLLRLVRGPPQHGLYSNKMALITSDCGEMSGAPQIHAASWSASLNDLLGKIQDSWRVRHGLQLQPLLRTPAAAVS